MIKEILKNKSSWELLGETELPIVLYGTGDGADKVIDELSRLEITLTGVMASDGFVRKRTFRGFEVKRAADFESELDDFIILIAFGTCLDEVIDNIKALSKKHKVIVPCVPVYGNEIINREFLLRFENELEKAYSLLADDKSKEVFIDFLMFELTGELEYLFKSETDKDEALFEILKIDKNECYLDLGAYKGDTVDELLKYSGGSYEKIVAVEPDIKTYAKLEKKVSQLENCKALNFGIWKEAGTMSFNGSSGRNSAVSQNGIRVETTTVDILCEGIPVTYIKADIEGCENEMLCAAKKTLGEKKPKLNIAAYHRSTDIFAIPIMINELNNEYKIHLRHHKYIPCWDLNYYCI